jgi:hypothetical protein
MKIVDNRSLAASACRVSKTVRPTAKIQSQWPEVAVSAARDLHNRVFRQKSHKLIAGRHGTELFRSAHPVIGFCKRWVESPIANVAVLGPGG